MLRLTSCRYILSHVSTQNILMEMLFMKATLAKLHITLRLFMFLSPLWGSLQPANLFTKPLCKNIRRIDLGLKTSNIKNQVRLG